MNILKRILSGLVMFIFGLETGGFVMWFLTIKALKDPEPRQTSQSKVSYRRVYDQ